MSHPDLIIVGSGLTGLIAAAAAKKSGLSVRIIEAREIFGGALRSIQSAGHRLPTSLRFIPDCESARHHLESFKTLLTLPFTVEEDSARAVTFESGDFRPFVGFGAATSSAIDELARMNNGPRLDLSVGPDLWIEDLLGQFSESELLSLSGLTGIEVQNGKISQIQINGAKWMTAERFIYTGSTTELERLLPESSLAPRVRTRLAKAKGLTSVSLHFLHKSQLTAELGYHFLAGSSGETDPLVGRFFPTDENGQSSTWMALITDDHTDDESIGQVIRYMKRQIKRAYPEALDGLIAEKIVIAPESHGTFGVQLKDGGVFTEIDNLFLATPRVSSEPGTLAAIERGLAAATWATPAIPVAAPEPVCYSATT